ncbi:unnamed protein product [Darwinula stevensoni]|uniref:Uncharacterized protein n=1 Tax=Darwinula stevensoni TaxID=69355 RepID=A0A7R8XEI8_9CRUS|nr:unnamed protein product [Darwinula stevensoni]CAG0895348.1 unnamed protein product [Darwinula stevensoni]
MMVHCMGSLGLDLLTDVSWTALHSALKECGESVESGEAGRMDRLVLGVRQWLQGINDTRAGRFCPSFHAEKMSKFIDENFADLLKREEEREQCIVTRLGFVQNNRISLSIILNFFTTSHDVHPIPKGIVKNSKDGENMAHFPHFTAATTGYIKAASGVTDVLTSWEGKVAENLNSAHLPHHYTPHLNAAHIPVGHVPVQQRHVPSLHDTHIPVRHVSTPHFRAPADLASFTHSPADSVPSVTVPPFAVPSEPAPPTASIPPVQSPASILPDPSSASIPPPLPVSILPLPTPSLNDPNLALPLLPTQLLTKPGTIPEDPSISLL